MFPLSSRSRPSGPGSRGGHFHEIEWRKAYYRKWRLDHPEYRERNKLRCKERRRRLQLELDRLYVDSL